MIYIFEDHDNATLSQFFRSAYPEDISRQFIYVGGNGNLNSHVKDNLSNDDYIIVYMDAIPGNASIIDTWRELRKTSRDNDYRVIVLPIVCAEYYLLQSIVHTNVIQSQIGLEECLGLNPYFNSAAIVTDADRVFVKNFEKYCKLILRKNLHTCANLTSEANRQFYIGSCLCNAPQSGCTTQSLCLKAVQYVTQYPCFPGGIYEPEGLLPLNLSGLSVNQLWDTHRRLVADFEAMRDRFAAQDHTRKYGHLMPFK